MNPVDLVTIRLIWDRDEHLPWAPHWLRGAIAERFTDNPLFHQHDHERLVYRYPSVQYRWDREGPIILGLGEGARFLVGVDWVGMELRIGEQVMTVRDALCHFRRHHICPAPRLLRYRFVSPWLPFSQENYQRYRGMTPAEQAAERDRLAVANLLMALRGVDVEFPGRLYAAFELHSARQCHYKDVSLLGFRGNLLANVDIPDDFAIGRATSHGYGWLCRPSTQSPDEERDARNLPSNAPGA